MMWHEFENIAGYQVTCEDYHDYIEPMYMALDGVTKQEFVRMIDKKRFALKSPEKCLREVRKEARNLFAICGIATDYDSERRMYEAAKEYALRKYGIEWGKDKDAYTRFEYEYQYPDRKGCSYPAKLVIGVVGGFCDEVKLQRN